MEDLSQWETWWAYVKDQTDTGLFGDVERYCRRFFPYMEQEWGIELGSFDNDSEIEKYEVWFRFVTMTMKLSGTA